MNRTASTTLQVVEFVRAIALAWKNLAAYPPGHPSLSGALDSVHQRLSELRGPGGDVVFGVAADALMYGEDKIDSTFAQKFAHALYTRGVALLRFESDVSPRDLDTFLRLVGIGTATQPQPLGEQLTAAGVTAIHLQPVDYSAVQVTDTLEAEPPPAASSSSLWDEILRALLAGRVLTAEARQMLSRPFRSVDELSAMILRYVHGEPERVFDPNATFGVKMKARLPGAAHDDVVATATLANAIGSYIGQSKGLRRAVAAQQVVQLLKALPQQIRAAIIRSVMRVLATDESAAATLQEFSQALPSSEVVNALQYLSTMTGLSQHAIKLLESLAPAKREATETKTQRDILMELVGLFGDEDIDRFNPPAHDQLVATISIPQIDPTQQQKIELLGERVDTVADDALNRQVAKALLDVALRRGTLRAPQPLLIRGERIFRAELSRGQFEDALDYIVSLQEVALTTENSALRDAVEASFVRLCSSETIEALVESLLSAKTEHASTIRRLIETMGASAIDTLLIRLAEENNRSRRRRLFDFVSSFGPVIVPHVTAFLSDSRWYVVRNIIVLLRGVNDRTALGEIRRCAYHHDLRVRLEAIKTLLAFDTSVPSSLLEKAIRDPDPKLAETAISLVGSYGIKEAVDPLLQMIAERDFFGTRKAIRIKAIRALGELAEAKALEQLSRFFRDSIFPWPAREERHAAWESLAAYPADVRTPLVEKGLRSRDPHVREICRRMRVS